MSSAVYMIRVSASPPLVLQELVAPGGCPSRNTTPSPNLGSLALIPFVLNHLCSLFFFKIQQCMHGVQEIKTSRAPSAFDVLPSGN